MINIIINGTGLSGKDTFVNTVQDFNRENYLIYNYSTIDLVKESVKVFGISSRTVKENNYRLLLSNIKKAVDIFNSDLITEEIYKRISANTSANSTRDNYTINFIHCREPENIDRLKGRLLNTATLLITRNILDDVDYGNDSDSNVNDYKYDFVFENNFESLEEYRIASIKFFYENFLK